MTEINEIEIAEKLSAMKLELMNLSELVPDPLNTKNHPEKQIELIAQSMKRRWTNPILIDDDKMIVAGHGRRLAALKLGLKKVPVIVLHNLTEAERIQYQIFDNKSAEMAEWNFENLQAQLDRLAELGEDLEATGWSTDELNEQLADMDDEPKEVNIEKLDNAPEVPEKVRTNRDDELFLFLIAAFKNIKRYLRKGRAFYIWYANSNHVHFETAIKGVELKPKQVIIWDKGMVLGHSDYHWAYEPCFYGCHEGENNKWFGDRSQKTFWKTNDYDFDEMPRDQLVDILKALKEGREIWTIKRDNASTYVHPTQKPVELAQRAMVNSCLRNEIVLDLFGGSGSTLVAGENMGRKVRSMELDPRYVDVEVQRWQDLFGGRAKRESDGTYFDEVEGRDYDSYNQE